MRIHGYCQVHCSPHTYVQLHSAPPSNSVQFTCKLFNVFWSASSSGSSTCTHVYCHLHPSHWSQMWTSPRCRNSTRNFTGSRYLPAKMLLIIDLYAPMYTLMLQGQAKGFPATPQRHKMAAPGGSIGVETQVAHEVCNGAVSSIHCLPLMHS